MLSVEEGKLFSRPQEVLHWRSQQLNYVEILKSP